MLSPSEAAVQVSLLHLLAQTGQLAGQLWACCRLLQQCCAQQSSLMPCSCCLCACRHSFFLAEVCKYLYLLFDQGRFLKVGALQSGIPSLLLDLLPGCEGLTDCSLYVPMAPAHVAPQHGGLSLISPTQTFVFLGWPCWDSWTPVACAACLGRKPATAEPSESSPEAASSSNRRAVHQLQRQKRQQG